MLTALIDGGRGSLASRAGLTPGGATSNALEGLRRVLRGVPGFRGEIAAEGPLGAWVLVLREAVAGGQAAVSGLAWQGATLEQDGGQPGQDGWLLRFQEQEVRLDADQARLLTALASAPGGGPLFAGQLITGDQAQQDIHNAAAGLQQVLRTLDGFPGRLLIRAGGFRLATVRTWNGLSLDPDTGELSYQGHTQTLTEHQTRVLAALIDGGPGSLASRAGIGDGKATSTVVAELQEVLRGLPGFHGQIIQHWRSAGWVLVWQGGASVPGAGAPLAGLSVPRAGGLLPAGVLGPDVVYGGPGEDGRGLLPGKVLGVAARGEPAAGAGRGVRDELCAGVDRDGHGAGRGGGFPGGRG